MSAEYKPGVTCVIVDHPAWEAELALKRLVIGKHVVLLYRLDKTAPSIIRWYGARAWKVSGVPAEFLAAKAHLPRRFTHWPTWPESVLEPLPPIDLSVETEEELTV